LTGKGDLTAHVGYDLEVEAIALVRIVADEQQLDVLAWSYGWCGAGKAKEHGCDSDGLHAEHVE
jgi:hypothetical protein